MNFNFTIRNMLAEDYEKIFAVWQITSKKALSSADSKENIAAFLGRNPELSKVALCSGEIIGSVLAGHDGRRGFFYHLSVLPQFRRHHIATKMVTEAMADFKKNGIEKTHIFCYVENAAGQNFWQKQGFEQRGDILVFSSAT
ncbi:MAG: GNAT family N-acetyltransferase [Oscillospiraceae bacterium]|nr:GNAT family N-acetyltransferase [Oscillospiraceae bacterium]